MIEVARFLASHPPFMGLTDVQLEDLATQVQIEFFSAGSVILRQGSEPSRFVYVLRRGIVELRDGDRIVDELEEGELFGFPSLLSGDTPVFTVRVAQDALCYLFDRAVALDLFEAPTGVRFLAISLRRRADRALPEPGLGPGGSLVGSVAASPLVTVDPDTTIRAAARDMTDAGASAAVIGEGDKVGIVTDRDIRARVVASGGDLDAAVWTVASMPALTIDADSIIEDALLAMLDRGIHHLPVTADGAVVGMLTDLDLLGLERRDAFRLRSEMDRAPSRESVVAVGRRLRDSIATLYRSGVDADHIGHVMAVLYERLTSRLLSLAAEELGPPVVPWVWVSLGSAARREQSLMSDQDHALLYSDGGDDTHFEALAAYVVEGLEQSGFRRCDRRIMATERAWRSSISSWRRRLEHWMQVTDEEAAFLAGIAFDVRPVSGSLDIMPLYREAAHRAGRDREFLRRFGMVAVTMALPIGLRGNLVVHTVDGHPGVLDLKQGGLLPITEMARLYALAAGSTATATTARLAAAVDAGVLDSEAADGLGQAFAVFRDLRMGRHVEAHEAGRPPSDLVRPDELGQLERRHIKDSFKIIRDVQQDLAERITARRLGTG